jgi:hypothetical protein
MERLPKDKNTQAYYEHPLITAVKSFITYGLGVTKHLKSLFKGSLRLANFFGKPLATATLNAAESLIN